MSQFNFNYIFQNKNIRLPATISSLEPDCSSINLAEKSNQPKDWLLHPIGYVFQFNAQKTQKPALPVFHSISDSDTSSSFTKRLKSFLTCSFK